MNALLVSAALLACSDAPTIDDRASAPAPNPQTDYAEPGPYEIAELDFPDLLDPARDNRSVPIKVHYPVQSGSYRLVVFSLRAPAAPAALIRPA